jgi:hypothetical protein
MSYQNTTKHSSGAILTGRLWRKDNAIFNDLPFYTDITRMDDMAEALQEALNNGSGSRSYVALLIVS